MLKNFYILGYLLIFFSCVYEKPLEENISTHSIKKGMEIKKAKDSLINDSISKIIRLNVGQDDDSSIVLCEEFDDSLTIYLDTLLIAHRKFTTDRSTGCCKPIILSWKILKKSSNLYFYKGSKMLYKMVLYAPKRYLHVRRMDGRWWYESFDDVVMFE